jgi:hypothetical protein
MRGIRRIDPPLGGSINDFQGGGDSKVALRRLSFLLGLL